MPKTRLLQFCNKFKSGYLPGEWLLLLIKLVNNISMLNIENVSSATIFVHCRAIFSNEFALRILRNGEVEIILG